MQRSRIGRGDGQSADVTASELASFVYCAKAWHLERILGASVDVEGVARREAGSIAHAAHGLRSMTPAPASRSPWPVALLVVVGLLLAALAFLIG